MGYSQAWDSSFEATPAGSDSIANGDDRIRELKVAVRERCRDNWWDETGTISYKSGTEFTVSGSDLTGRYVSGRAIKAEVTAGTVYSHVSSSSYDATTAMTTVTLRDSVLDSGLSAVYFGPDPNSDAYAAPAIVPLGGKTGGELKVSSAGSDVTIKPGYREVGGKWYHWNSEITFTIGPAGSNPDSEANPTSADWVYIYIDESALPSDNTTELTASNFISKTTEPAKSTSKHGWYDGNDRCIGGLYHDGTNLQPQEFAGGWHEFYFDPPYDLNGSAAAGSTWYDLKLSMLPVFSKKARLWMSANSGGVGSYATLRPKGSTQVAPPYTLYQADYAADVLTIPTDDAQYIQYLSSGNSVVIKIKTLAWFADI